MRLFLFLIFILFTVSACTNRVKEKIGVLTAGPDEYQVTRNRALEVPPHYDLPEINDEQPKTAGKK